MSLDADRAAGLVCTAAPGGRPCPEPVVSGVEADGGAVVWGCVRHAADALVASPAAVVLDLPADPAAQASSTASTSMATRSVVPKTATPNPTAWFQSIR